MNSPASSSPESLTDLSSFDFASPLGKYLLLCTPAKIKILSYFGLLFLSTRSVLLEQDCTSVTNTTHMIGVDASNEEGDPTFVAVVIKLTSKSKLIITPLLTLF